MHAETENYFSRPRASIGNRKKYKAHNSKYVRHILKYLRHIFCRPGNPPGKSPGNADKNGGRKIFDYFASGWNRDGLALRAAGELVRSAPLSRHLVLLLTDASPNDSHRIPPGGAYPLGRDYADRAAVEDTAREVRALRQKNVRVAAVFTGEDRSAGDAEEIYGRSLARIRTMDQLAGAAGALIRREIQELSD